MNSHATNSINHQDINRDSIPDGWKIEHGLDVHDKTLAGKDEDGDGLTTRQEWQYDTDPDKADTDGDGTSGGAEIAQGSNPNDASDNGQAPEDPIEEIEFKSGGDYAVWEMLITGKGPRDTRSFRFLSRPADQERGPVGYSDPHTFKLWKNNSYEISYTRRGGEKDWFCWAGAVDGKPDKESSPQGSGNPDTDSFIVKDHWLVDSRDGLLTSHQHSQGSDKASSLKATLIPIGFKTYPDSEPGPYKPHLRNLGPPKNEADQYPNYSKFVAHVYQSGPLKLTDYLHGADDSGIRQILEENIKWRSNNQDVTLAGEVIHYLNWVGEPDPNKIDSYKIEVLSRESSEVLDRLMITVVPRSTETAFAQWKVDNQDPSWLAELPPLYSSLEPSIFLPTPPPGTFIFPRPDRNCPDPIWETPKGINSYYHPEAYYEIRSVETPGGHGHQACYNENWNLIREGVSAGTADKVHPSNWRGENSHTKHDVLPFIWALQLDGNPTEGTEPYPDLELPNWNLTKPIAHEGAFAEKYLQLRPPIANLKPELQPGTCP